MPVEGLPSTLECMLNSALQHMMLSSYKIEGREDYTVVVLRLKTNTGHSPVTLPQRSGAVFRRKCLSQVNRDRRRAEQHRRNQQASDCVSSPSGLFLPTPPSLFYETNTNNGNYFPSDTRVLESDNRAPSSLLPLSASDQQIDMTQDVTDTQLVAVPYGNDWTEQTVLDDEQKVEDCETDCETGDAFQSDSQTVPHISRDTDHDKCSSVGSTKETSIEINEPHEVSEPAQSNITIRDIMTCLEESAREMDRKMDSLLSEFKQIGSDTYTAGRNGNLHEDPT